MNILDTIVAHKKKEVATRRQAVPIKDLERQPGFARPVYPMTRFIRQADKSGIIAEFKRRSPSKGDINMNASVGEVTVGYTRAGASAISVLTDTDFFGGSSDDLITARELNSIPMLRKDFTIDEYQVVEAKSMGADAVLLIAAALEPAMVRSLAACAHGLNLQVLLEVHNEAELRANLDAGADLIGVNNRNLKTFELNVDVSRRLASLIPDTVVKISESGIESVDTILDLRGYGYEGFLMGQNFMQHARPDAACREFIDELKAASAARIR